MIQTITIQKLLYGGKAYAKDDTGREFFIIGDILPGEKGEIKIIKEHNKKVEALLIKRLTTSPSRVKAPCQYFGICQGCFLQNLPYEKQLETKHDYMQEFFNTHLEGNTISLPAVMPSPDPLRFRHKIIWNFFTDDTDNINIGYFKEYPEYQELNLEDCHLYDEKMKPILECARKWAQDKKLTTYHNTTKTGLLRSITLRNSKTYNEWMIAITTTQEDFDIEIFDDLINDLQNNINLKSFYWRKAPINEVIGKVHYDTHIWGQTYITEKCSGIDFKIHFGDFFQNNVGITEKMIDYVIQNIDKQSSTLLDLYCGVGTFTLPIAKQKPELHVQGIELVKTAIEAAKENAQLNNIKNTSFIADDIQSVIHTHLADTHYDTILVDPPRAGLKENVCNALLNTHTNQIIYVSCNAKTMVKDLNRLQKKYTIEKIHLFDMFPQTYHIETIVILRKK